MNLKNPLFFIFLVLSMLFFASPILADFDFQGYTKYLNGTNMSNVNVSVSVLSFQEGGPPTTITTVNDASDDNGYFNVTFNATYDNSSYMYKPLIVKYNATNALAEYIGQSLPELMYDEFSTISATTPITFYLKPAVTIDISGIGIEHGIQDIQQVSNVSYPTNYKIGLGVVNESGIQLWSYINNTNCLILLNSSYAFNRSFCNLNITSIRDLEYYQPSNTYYFLNTTQVEKCNVSGASIDCITTYTILDRNSAVYTSVGGIEYIGDLNQFYISGSNGTAHWIDAYNFSFSRFTDDNSTDRPDYADAAPGKLKYYSGYIYEIMNQSSFDNNYDNNLLRCSIYGNKVCEDNVAFFSGENVTGIERNIFDNKWYYASAANASIVYISDPYTTAFNFFYQIKDTVLGYSVKETFSSGGNGVTSARFILPQEGNYSMMIYPNNGPGFPSKVLLSNLSEGSNISLGDRNVSVSSFPYYLNLSSINLTTEFVKVSGYAFYNSSAVQQNYTNYTVIAYLLEPGNMVYKGATLPQNMGQWQWPPVNDVFNTTSGFYNMTLPASVLGADILLFSAVSKNISGTVTNLGGFKTTTLTYGESPSEKNVTLYSLAGEQSNLSLGFEGQSGAPTVVTSQKRFIIQDSNGTAVQQAHVEVELVYPASQFNGSEISFSWMAEVSSTANGVLYLPLFNYSIKSMQVFSQQYAPRKKPVSLADMQENPVYFNLSSFENKDPEGNVFNDIEMMMYKSSSDCSVPNPGLNCYLIPLEDKQNSSNFNPFSIVLGGGKLDFEMKKTNNNITVRYVNVNLLASGPPDAMFDDSANSSTSGTSLADVWKFGSSGPEIYDHILIGVPYNTSALNESKDVKINITDFYDDSWASTWDQSMDASELSGTDYADYNSTTYNGYIDGNGVLCNSTDENLSTGLCYKDIVNNMLWFKIPHFSGIGPSIIGSAVSTVTLSSSTTPSSSSGGGGAASVQTANTIITSILANVRLGEEAKFIFNGGSLLTEINLISNMDLINAKMSVTSVEASKISNYVSKTLSAPKVYKYYEIKAETFTDSAVKGDANIKFDVEKAWLIVNNIDKSNIIIYRFTDKWDALPVKIIGEDSNRVHYSALTSGFSYFAIATKASSVVKTQEVTNTSTTPEKINTIPEIGVKGLTLGNWAVIVVGILIILLVVYAFVLHKKKH